MKTLTIIVKRKRNKHLSPETWKQNEAKQKRLKGMLYKAKSGNEITAKAMGPPCNSKFCQRVTTRDCQSITEEQRQWIFQKVWSMENWEERRIYVTTLVTKVAIKQRKVAEGSRRNSSFCYQLKLQDGASHKVCKALFCSTLGLPERTITYWLNEDTINHDDLRVAGMQSWKPPSQISLRTGWRTYPLLIRTTAEAQQPTKTRSSFTQAQPSPNYIGNINRQLQLLEWWPLG